MMLNLYFICYGFFFQRKFKREEKVHQAMVETALSEFTLLEL